MREKLGFLVCVWLMVCGSCCMGRFVGLEVISPDSLKGVYEYANEDFRTLQYGGGSMVGTVVYPKANQKACRNFDDVGVFFKSKPGGQRIFLLVNRGDCYFALKAWNAQNGGAAAILIADDRIEPLNTLGSDEEDDPDSEYVHDILIPSALISKSFGDTIKKAISCGETVKMGLNWVEALPHPDNSITYEFWTNSNGKYGPKFVVEKNCLKVNSLSSLGGVYECAIGNVGVPHYGGTMFGTVVYTEANRKACNSFADVDIFKSWPGGLPVIFLADRGGQLLLKKYCYFTLKAWNAQNGGAAAILVADNKVEPLITMDTPEEYNADVEYVQNITIPSALISKYLGDRTKKALSSGEMVNLNLDWTEALPHPDEWVEYEFWTTSNGESGSKCNNQIDIFVKNFKGAAQILEQKGYTKFTPRYMTWYCPFAFYQSKQCRSQCINFGRYCAQDPEQYFSRGYNGKDVVFQNLCQACFFKVANENGKPWLWWDYVTDFAIRCSMKEKKYNKDCSDQVIKSLGIDLRKIETCVGDPNADIENPVLKAEQDAQVGKGTRGDITILPTLVIKNRQYRGKLDKALVLKAICAGFQETMKPAIFLKEDIETNECLHNNGGCWQDKSANVTACKDTFRGRVCECPTVQGVKYVGDGYTHREGVHLMKTEKRVANPTFYNRKVPTQIISNDIFGITTILQALVTWIKKQFLRLSV